MAYYRYFRINQIKTKTMRTQWLLFIASLLPISLSAQFTRLDPTSLTTIEGYIQSQKASSKMVGLSVGIIRNGEIAYLKGFGYQDSLKNIQASENTMYRLASISKSVTGLMAMRLIEKGLLDLNKDIRDYVPEYPVKSQGTITSEDLLSNESGVIHYSGSANCTEPYNFVYRDTYINGHKSTYDPIAAIGIFKDQKICFTPGDQYQYTTWGFCLMGAVLQRAGGQNFEDLLYQELVCPLGLPTLQIEFQSQRPYPNETAGYELVNGAVQLSDTNATDFKDISYKVPGGGLISSVIDLTLLMKGVVNREFIADSTVKLFGTRHTPVSGVPSYYGYGTSTNFRNGDTLFWHSGSQSQTATLIYYSPENKNGVALMCNTRGVSLFPLARLIYDYLPNSSLQGPVYVQPGPQSSCSLKIEDFSEDFFLAYPNPNRGRVSLHYNPDLNGKQLRLLSITGQVLYDEILKKENNQLFDLELSDGCYQLIISENEKVLHTETLIVKR